MKCRECDRPIHDRISKLFRVGSDCRKRMTPAQLRAAMEQTRNENDPAFIPPERPASPRAQRTNAVARATIALAQEPARAMCVHDGIRGACPGCRYEADPRNAAARIIREVQGERRAAREHAYRTWQAGQSEQLTLGGSHAEDRPTEAVPTGGLL